MSAANNLFAELPNIDAANRGGVGRPVKKGTENVLYEVEGSYGAWSQLGRHMSVQNMHLGDDVATVLTPDEVVESIIDIPTLTADRTYTLPTAALLVAYLTQRKVLANARPAAGVNAQATTFRFKFYNRDAGGWNITVAPGANGAWHDAVNKSIGPNGMMECEVVITNAATGTEAYLIYPVSRSSELANDVIVVHSAEYNAGDAGTELLFIANGDYEVIGWSGMPIVDATAQADFTLNKVNALGVGNLISGGALNLNGSIDYTRVEGTLTATKADLILAADDAIQLTLTGVATNLDGAKIQVRLRRLA
jgi:hypothetical protein